MPRRCASRRPAPNTGIFVGYIQTRAAAVTAGNCVLEVERNAQIDTRYVDAVDSTDTSSASALVDPYGLIFDSRTGTPINGARVRLIDATSGLPAAVVGDDGVSSYPSEMLTGSPVTDGGGTVYTLPAGVFRFPLVAPGSYRLAVDPPVGHAFPSTLSIADLGQTPGGPYRLSAGSFGAPFAADTPPAVAVDVPLDAAATQLFVQKTTTTTVAAVGDFVQYQLTVENTSTNAAVASVRTVDQLPLGARYRARSTRIGGAVAPDPEISADGRTLTFTSGALGPGQRLDIRYVVEITAGARGKQLVNAARAIGPDGIASNSAQATIRAIHRSVAAAAPSTVRLAAPNSPLNRAIEAKVSELEGHKSLYSESFYARDTFDRLYDGANLAAVKQRYDPDERLTSLYDKAVRRC